MIKARQDYTIKTPAGDVETIRVVGWEDVEVGIEGSTRWPKRVERWCRVRLADGGRLLMHPDRIAQEMTT